MCLMCVSFMCCKKETSAAQEESLLSQIPSELRDIFHQKVKKYAVILLNSVQVILS